MKGQLSIHSATEDFMLLLELVKGMSLQDLRFKLSMVSNMCMIYVVKASLSIRTREITRLDITMHPLIQHIFFIKSLIIVSIILKGFVISIAKVRSF